MQVKLVSALHVIIFLYLFYALKTKKKIKHCYYLHDADNCSHLGRFIYKVTEMKNYYLHDADHWLLRTGCCTNNFETGQYLDERPLGNTRCSKLGCSGSLCLLTTSYHW